MTSRLTWTIGRAFGAPLTIDAATVVVWCAATIFVWERIGRPDAPQAWLWAFAMVASVAGSVVVHELAHAFAGYVYGARIHHISLTAWGGLTRFSASSLPPLRYAWIALAGPAANLAIAGGAWYLSQAVGGGPWASVAEFAVLANLILAAFNALPGAPLDGGAALSAIVWRVTGVQHRGLAVAAWSGRVVVVAVGAVLIAMPLVTEFGNLLVNIVLAYVVGLIMWRATTQQLVTARVMAYVEDIAPQDLLRPVVTARSDATVADTWMRLAGTSDPVLVIDDQDAPEGLVYTEVLDMVPAQARERTALSAVMVYLAPDDVWETWDTTDAHVARWVRLMVHPRDVVVDVGGGAWALISASSIRQYQRMRPLDWKA